MKRTIALIVTFVSFVSFTCFADALVQAHHNKYFKCQHTKQSVDRSKSCPCGCNKKKRTLVRLVSADDHCESDDVVAHAPLFEKLVSSPLAPELIRGQAAVTRYLPVGINLPASHTLSPPVPPG